eukprot:XP_001698735.1 predicted protein [Chlamydomonas reinhardtii]
MARRGLLDGPVGPTRNCWMAGRALSHTPVGSPPGPCACGFSGRMTPPQLLPSIRRRSVVAGSTQTRNFNMQFDPSKSNIPLEYNFSQPLEVSPAPANWPEGAPDGVMDAGPYVEAVEMDLHYGRELPRWVWQDGTLVFRPGFLTAPIDPDVPPYWLHRGIARFTLGRTDMAVQAVVGAAYLAFLAAVSAALYAVQPQLLAAVAVSWARNTLSLAKWGALLALAAADRVYLYWVFLAGKTVDQLLAKHAPPVRTFMWANAALWAVYLAVSPSGASLLPGVLA